MRRQHLVELEDLPGLPAAVRDGAIDLLDAWAARLGVHETLAPVLAEVLRSTGAAHLVDLCSGAGGPTVRLHARLTDELARCTVTLTDRYPSASGRARIATLGDPRVAYEATPVDALSGGGERQGLRLMSGALHHFPPDAVAGILAAIIRQRQPLCFFDVAAAPLVRRLPVVAALPAIAVNAVLLVLVALAVTPLVRPVRPSRLALTYLLPVIPLVFAWDGTVSALRAYTPEELLAIAARVPGSEHYRWNVQRLGPLLAFTGLPR